MRALSRHRHLPGDTPAWLISALDAVDALPRPPARVVLLVDDDAVPAAAALARLLPHATVMLMPAADVDRSLLGAGIQVTVAADLEERTAALYAGHGPDLLLERITTTEAEKVQTLRRLLPVLSPKGRYLVERLPGDARVGDEAGGTGKSVWELLGRVEQAIATGDRRPPGAALFDPVVDAVNTVTIGRDRAVVSKRGAHRLMLRDATANALLARTGTSWGSVIEVLPGEEFRPSVVARNHGEPHAQPQPPVISVPERYLREYRGALVTSHQVAYTDRMFLPDTFRHPTTSSLFHHRLVGVDGFSARFRRRPTPAADLLGRYFYFDTEYPGHFGHVITEVMGRAAGWRRAAEHFPDIRPLVSLGRGQSGVPGFQAEMFRALGIDPDTIAYVPAQASYRVESLVAESPGFVMPFYAAPELAAVWRELGDRLVAQQVRPAPPAERLFISRRAGRRRHCHQTEEVEAFFADEGFAIVYPEDLPFPEQVALLRSAEIVAGFAGSGLFTTMFSEVRRRVVIASSSYTANNEYLIAALQGGTLDTFWGVGDTPRPEVGFDQQAFQSHYSFDVAGHADALRRTIEG